MTPGRGGDPLRGSAACALLALAVAGCPSGTGPLDGGAPLDVPTIEGGTLRPDATVSDGGAPAPDAGSRCPGVCDPRSTTGCSGGVCSLGTGIPACVTEAGTAGLGEGCTTPDGCDAGLGCFRDRETGLGVCRRVCCPHDGRGCEPTERCGGAGELALGERTEWGECLPARSCDVLAPADCPSREGCYIVDADATTECRFAGTAEAGATCERPEDCAPGLFCGGLGPRTCLVVCALAAARGCPDGTRCVAQSYSPAESGICVRDMLAR